MTASPTDWLTDWMAFIYSFHWAWLLGFVAAQLSLRQGVCSECSMMVADAHVNDINFKNKNKKKTTTNIGCEFNDISPTWLFCWKLLVIFCLGVNVVTTASYVILQRQRATAAAATTAAKFACYRFMGSLVDIQIQVFVYFQVSEFFWLVGS